MLKSELFKIIYRNIIISKNSLGDYFDQETKDHILNNYNSDTIKSIIPPLLSINDYYLEYIMQILAVSITNTLIECFESNIENNVDLNNIYSVNSLISEVLESFQ